MRIWLLLLALLTPVTAESHLPITGPAAVELYELAPAAPPPVIKAQSAIMIDVDSGKTLYQLDPHGRHAPASLTKIVTALVALDHLRLDQTVLVPVSINQLPWDSTRMGLRAGERLTVRELLYGLFLNSGAAMAATPSLTLPATATHHAYALYNLNELVRKYPGATGLKTGWTGHAGGCLIATATRDGRHLMVILLASPRIFDEAAVLLDYGFARPS